MRILVVDDDKLILSLVKEILRSVGIKNVVTADSATAALAEISSANQPFDFFILDIVMRETDGIELCRILRQDSRYKATPILMVTAKSDRSHIDRAFGAGATDYITKPFILNQLITRIFSIKYKMELESKRDMLIAEEQRAIPSRPHTFEFSNLIEISDIPGLIKFSSFENYLLQISRNKLMVTQLFSFKVCNAGKLYASTQGDVFKGILRVAAEALSDTLRQSDFFVSYAGHGAFVCASRGNQKFDLNKIETTVSEKFRTLMQRFSIFTSTEFKMRAGSQIRIGFFRTELNALAAVNIAIENAERQAYDVH